MILQPQQGSRREKFLREEIARAETWLEKSCDQFPAICKSCDLRFRMNRPLQLVAVYRETSRANLPRDVSSRVEDSWIERGGGRGEG